MFIPRVGEQTPDIHVSFSRNREVVGDESSRHCLCWKSLRPVFDNFIVGTRHTPPLLGRMGPLGPLTSSRESSHGAPLRFGVVSQLIGGYLRQPKENQRINIMKALGRHYPGGWLPIIWDPKMMLAEWRNHDHSSINNPLTKQPFKASIQGVHPDRLWPCRFSTLIIITGWKPVFRTCRRKVHHLGGVFSWISKRLE